MIPIKSKSEVDLLRQAGKILSSIVRELRSSLKIGTKSRQIDEKAEELIRKHNVVSAFKGYRGFPNCTCISFNQEVVHGIPNDRIIKEGDIVSVDIGILKDQYYSDMAFTVGFEKLTEESQNLIETTQEALYRGIEQAVPGNHLFDISFAVQSFVESRNLSVVRDFVGHGIGKKLHEDPEVPNFGLPHSGPILKEGMVLAIEPMVNIGTWKTEILNDGWTVVTRDGRPSAHFEHTVAITQSGPEILTS